MTERLEQTSIRRQIVSAFSGTRYPGDDNIGYDKTGEHLECKQVAEHFRGVNWKDVDLAFLRRYGEHADLAATLSFMSPDAFRYYLPAFLLVLLRNFGEADMLRQTVISSITPRIGGSNKALIDFVTVRLDGFSNDQRVAIRLFLKFLKQEHGEEYLFGELDTALAHWSE